MKRYLLKLCLNDGRAFEHPFDFQELLLLRAQVDRAIASFPTHPQPEPHPRRFELAPIE
jgi:hypothetical protein